MITKPFVPPTPEYLEVVKAPVIERLVALAKTNLEPTTRAEVDALISKLKAGPPDWELFCEAIMFSR